MISRIDRFFARLACILIKIYRFVFAGGVPRCRFYPTCSHYAQEAFAKYGCVKGGLMAAKRLLKCHPFHSGGVDAIDNKL